MFHRPIFTGLVIASAGILGSTASAEVLNDFSALLGGSSFGTTKTQTAGAGFIEVELTQDAGINSATFSPAEDFTAFLGGSLELDLRKLAANESGVIRVSLRDSDGTDARYNFNITGAPDAMSAFATIASNNAFGTPDSISGGTTAGFNVAEVARYQISGTFGSQGLINVQLDELRIVAVPEPGSLGLLGLGAAAFLRRRRKTA